MAGGEQRGEPGGRPAGETDLIETEQKYDVGLDFVLPDLAGPGDITVGPAEVQQLAATYFDTADLRLAAAHITLRRRTGGSDAGWHIKLPVSADTRREVHFPLGEPTATVPDEVAAQIARWAPGPQLHPVARIETRRTVRRLAGRDGQVLAEVADDQVTGSRPDPADPARWRQVDAWREIEIELVSGTPAVLDAARVRLTAAGASRSPSASKLARVLGTS
jgi:inorganic triphosphatase YgiF